MFQQLPYNITHIDTGLMGVGVVSCYLLESNDQYAIIETGNFEIAERILKLLEQKNVTKDQVRYIIPTHVHLDHAGGASSLMDEFTDAKLVIHPSGAKHMIDPSKLIAGATAVYGEQLFSRLYGEIKPIDEQRIIIADDNSTITVGDRTLLFRDSPGHAYHHFCIWDELSSGWFTGDTFGIGYPQFFDGDIKFLFPTTTPVQFNPEALKSSVKLLMEYQPKRVYLTHFGMAEIDDSYGESLCQQIDDFVTITESINFNGDYNDQSHFELLKSRLADSIYEKLTGLGSTIDNDKFMTIMDNDLNLNSQGLMVWHSRLN